MHFMLSSSWYCQFLEADLKTPLPRTFHFQDPAKIVEMARLGGAPMMLEHKQALEYAIKTGRGSVMLSLTEEQYRKLQVPKHGLSITHNAERGGGVLRNF